LNALRQYSEKPLTKSKPRRKRKETLPPLLKALDHLADALLEHRKYQRKAEREKARFEAIYLSGLPAATIDNLIKKGKIVL